MDPVSHRWTNEARKSAWVKRLIDLIGPILLDSALRESEQEASTLSVL